MSDTGWTPGDWEIVSESRSDFVVGVRSNGGGYYEVCNIDWFDQDEDEGFANAHLVAAAPELYDELDRLAGELRACIPIIRSAAGSTNAHVMEQRVNSAIAALAKARGES